MDDIDNLTEEALWRLQNGPRPRSARWTERTRLYRLWSTNLWIFLFSVLVCWGSLDVRRLHLLATQGKGAQAQVTQKSEHQSRRSHTYTLRYEAQIDGRRVEGRTNVSSTVYNNTAFGDSLSLTYLPGDPSCHEIGPVTGESVVWRRIVWVWGVLGGALAVAAAVLYVEHDRRKQLRLLQSGVMATARVTDRRKAEGKTTTYYLDYSFPVEEKTGATQTRRNIAVSKTDWEKSEFPVLFLPENPAQNRPLFLLTAARLL